jgi:hypothetical protein
MRLPISARTFAMPATSTADTEIPIIAVSGMNITRAPNTTYINAMMPASTLAVVFIVFVPDGSV